MAGAGDRSRWLASDQDRDQAVQILSQALVDGRITTSEHGERVSKVLAARYLAQLDEITEDIPSPERLPAPRSDSALAATGPARTHGLLRSTSLRPCGSVPQLLRSGAVLGNAEIDLRDAAIPADGLDVKLWAYLGDVTVIVPPLVRVQLLATPILGQVENTLGSAPRTGPVVRIRAWAIFGDISVRAENPSSPPQDS
jgi:Domain of unknown function (DUF1707)